MYDIIADLKNQIHEEAEMKKNNFLQNKNHPLYYMICCFVHDYMYM